MLNSALAGSTGRGQLAPTTSVHKQVKSSRACHIFGLSLSVQFVLYSFNQVLVSNISKSSITKETPLMQHGVDLALLNKSLNILLD